MARKQVKPDRVRVRVLGATELQIGSRRVGMNTEALFALALYLTTRAGERIAREQVLEIFWTDGAEESRRHAMRQMMYRLRQKGLELDEDGEFLRLDPAHIESDLRDCLQADWPERAGAAAVEAALALGPTFSARLAAPFLDWFDGVRAEVAAQHRKAAAKQITLARREGRWSELERWARSVLQSDPLNEEATLARAESAAMSGSKVAALEILDTYLAEIGQVAPELGKPAVVLRKRIAEKRADWTQRGPREVRLIGRSDLMRKLNAFADSVTAGDSKHLVLEGPPGSGKSRLLAEAGEYSQLRGLRVLGVRAEKVMEEHPLAFCREIAAQLVRVPGAAGVSPATMKVASSLAEEAAQFRTDAIRPTPQLSVSSIAGALSGLLSAIGSEQRFVLVLDDLQWADDLSLKILGELIRAASHSRVGIVAGTRPHSSGLQLNSVAAAFDQLHRVNPLVDEYATDLANETAKSHGRVLDAAALAAILRTAGGNPLFVRELTIARSAWPHRTSLPDSLSQIVEDRIRTLDAREQRLLRITALLGDVAALSRVRATAALSHSELQHSLERLEAESMIRMSGERTLSVHDCWSEVLLQQTPATSLAALALECAERLIIDSAARSHAVQRRTGHLLRLAGENDRALEYFLASTDSLHAIGLPREARDSMASYSELANHPTAQARLKYRSARSLSTLGNPESAIAIVEELRRHGWLRQNALWQEHLDSILILAEAYIRTENADHAPTDEALTLAFHPNLGADDQQKACLLGVRIASNRADARLMRDFAERSKELDGTGARSYASWMTALVHATECGSAADILDIIDSASVIDRSDLTVHQTYLMHRFACQALRVARKFHRSLEHGTAAHDLAIEHGLYHQARVGAELLAHVCLDYEEITAAREWISRSEHLSTEAAVAATTRSHDHVKDRLSVQEGKFDEVCGRILARLPSSRVAGTPTARLGELSLAALCLSQLGRHEEAELVIAETLEAVSPILGQYSSNFAVELTARSLRLIGNGKRADQLLRDHMHSRIAKNPPTPPPFFMQLMSVENSLSLSGN